MSTVSTVADWAPHVGVSLFTRLVSFVRSAWVMVVVDNPLSWRWGYRGQNEKDDVEGPFYIVGAPDRQIDDGKAVLASADYLKKYGPFLFLFEVKDAKGEPIPNAILDWWQADSEGGYYFASWTLRGKLQTDAHGRAEVLSVRPGDYGSDLIGRRAGHIHLIISGDAGRHRPMTTQAYVCPGNRASHMEIDAANYARSARLGNMATAWSIPAANGGDKYWELPELPVEDIETAKRVSWWNAKLKEHGIDREVVAVARQDFKLSIF
ncbi:Intradiol ring-cleavage dioxygenase [Trametes meyenii]|nr:Intradiol ring-cleavage dioxygenase [Trametes meyenii]